MIKSLYVHIPFCRRKCFYCDFNSCAGLDSQQEYIRALTEEIKRIEVSSFETVFIGGGTPTILSLSCLKMLLEALKPFNPGEFTVECNPGTVDCEKVMLLRDYGINRISVGLQAWQGRLLHRLGRIHNLSDFLLSYEILRDKGFKNINIDLMFGIPGQTMRDWCETLANVMELKPEHLSCYSLIIEEGTPFFDMYNEGRLMLPDEDTEREMYYVTVEKLKHNGLERYEISNFAKPGFECRHNITYWTDEEYIGVGAGAHSYVGNRRYSNFRKVGEYIKAVENGSPVEEESILTIDDKMSEFMFMGLRMMKGISKRKFKERFKRSIYDIYENEIEDLKQKNLIADEEDNIKLTERGIDFSNQVFVAFLR